MNLYFAGADLYHGFPDEFINLPGLKILLSYASIMDNPSLETLAEFAHDHEIGIFLDSGAFSTMTRGIKIDIYQYIDYCQKHPAYFEVIASLDVIFNWEQSLKNHQIMKDAGIQCIPTFHVNEPFSYLRTLLETEDYIGLGVGGMQKRRKQLFAWLIQCFKIREEINPSCKFHGFGLTGSDIMSSFPWHSVDSTGWLSARKFGQVLYLHRNKIYRLGRENYHKAPLYNIPEKALPKRFNKNEDYYPVDRWSLEVMLKWTQSLTLQRSK